MRSGRRGGLIATVLALAVVGACTGEVESGPSSTAASETATSMSTTSSTTSSTSTSTTTSSTTTTMSTLPPGLEAQVLSFRFEPEMLVRYDAVETTSFTPELVEASTGVFESLIGGVTLSGEVTGQLWQLVLPGPDPDTFETVWDFRPTEGTVGGEVEDFAYSEALEVESLEYFGGVVGPGLIDGFGTPSGASVGAPWFWKVNADPLDPMAPFGLPLIADAVDVGDSWSVVYEDPVFGLMSADVWIAEEVPNREGFAFAIEFEGEATALPLLLRDTAATRLVAAIEPELPADLLSVLAGVPEPDVEATVTAVAIRGSLLFDPDAGLLTSLDTSMSTELALWINAGPDTLRLAVETESVLAATLDEVVAPEGFERISVLDRVGVDARRFAEAGLDPLIAYGLVEIEEGEYEWELERMRQTPAVVGAIVYAKFTNGEQGAVVFSAVGAGRYRAAPILGEGLANEWNPIDTKVPPPRWTWVNGQLTFRLLMRGEDWTVWASDSHVFAVVGRNPFRDELVTVLMDGQPESYWWQAGDCLDLSNEFGSELPWAPVGPLGLRHCSGPHTWEVLDGWVLDEGEFAAYPRDLDLRVSQRCAEAYFERFDAPPLSQGLELAVFFPDRDEWELGRRYGACAVAEYDSGGIVMQEGRLTQERVSGGYEWEVGDCLVGGTYGITPVSCGAAHVSEVIAVLPYEAGSEEGWLDPSVGRDQFIHTCAAELWRNHDLDHRVRVFPVTDMYVGWEAGVREYYCVASVVDRLNLPVEITGDVLGEWEFAEEQVGT